MNGEILIDWALVSGAAVVLAFIVNQAASWLGYEPSSDAKKGVALAASFALAGFFAFQGDLGIPDFAADPSGFVFGLLGATALVNVAARQIYDRIWSGLVSA